MSEVLYTRGEKALSSNSQGCLGLFTILGGVNFFYADWHVWFTYSVLIIFSFFYLSIVGIQCYISFRCTTQ